MAIPISGRITFLPSKQVVEIRGESSVLELALKYRIDVDNSCGGSGSCGTCRVFVAHPKSNQMPARNEVEQAMAIDRQFGPSERLACQIEPTDGMVIQLPEE